MFLKAQDEALASRDVLRCGSRPLQAPQFGDVCAQMSQQPIYGPLVGHGLAGSTWISLLVGGWARIR